MQVLLLTLVVLGTIILMVSIYNSRHIHKVVPTSLRTNWFILTILLCFFVLGYCGYILMRLFNLPFPLDFLISSIFIGGAFFVYGIIALTNQTLSELNILNEDLESAVKQRTHQLDETNKSLAFSKEEIGRKRDFLFSIINALSHPLYVVDVKNFEVIMANEQAQLDLTGPDKTCHWLTHSSKDPCSGKSHPCPILEIRKTRRPTVLEHLHRLQSGELRNVEVHGHPIFNEEGELTQVIEYCVDITERKHIEKDLLEAKQHAEAANKAKSAFLANMSHEIRTPLNAVMGMSYLALQTAPGDKQKKYIEKVYSSAQHLLSLLGDILDFSKLEAGRLHINKVTFSLPELIADIVSIMESKAMEKNLRLLVQHDTSLPKTYQGDDMRIRQIILNLINNGIKFTQTGTVTLTLTRFQHHTESPLTVHFTVTDTGIGIRPEILPIIFTAFAQTDSSHTRQYGGTGLGLFISKQMVEIMGGNMWIESEVGQGSSFHFTLPLEPVSTEKPALSTDEKPSFARLHILLVDDNEINRDVARMMLEEAHDVQTATNGHEALQILSEKRFDCLFIDMEMPGLNGHETTAIIRALELKQKPPFPLPQQQEGSLRNLLQGKHLPIIAMTAHVLDEDQERCLEKGMDGYVSKPFHHGQLLSVLDLVARQQHAST